MNKIIPKMANMNLFESDILYCENDQSQQLFFVFNGSVLLYIDISNIINMVQFVDQENCFNIPVMIYSSGSYFGDNDVLLEKNGQRSHTAICQEDC